MSHAALAPQTSLRVQLLSLSAIVGLAFALNQIFTRDAVGFAPPLVALGLLLLSGDLVADIVERIGLPHLTGYLIAGVLLGPYGLHVVHEEHMSDLSMVNALALALIALSAGAELTYELLSKSARTLLFGATAQLLITMPACALAFFLLREEITFLHALDLRAIAAFAMIWSVIALSRSPSATLGVLAQLKPKGPLTNFTLALVIGFDLVVLLIFSPLLEVARVLIEPSQALELAAFKKVGLEVLGSAAAGVTFGLVVIAFLKLASRRVLLFLVVLSYGVTQFANYFHYDALLVFVIAGFIVANASRQSEKLLGGVSEAGRLVYVLFFANAGAHLNIGLVIQLWPVALTLVLVRVVASWIAARAGSALARDVPAVKRYGFLPLISQAGITIGMSVVVGDMFGTVGRGIQSLTIAVVGINEAIGPVLFKYALDKTGESYKQLEDHPPA